MKAIRWAIPLAVLLPALGFAACGLESAGAPGVGDGGPDVVAIDADAAPLPDTGADVLDAGPDVPAIDAGPLSPAQLPGLAFWVRSDQGLEIEDGGASDGGAVAAWRDISDAGVAHDLLPTAPPPRVLQGTAYAGSPGVVFGTNDTSKLSNATLAVPVPLTIFVVGHATTDVSYFLDSASTSSRVSILTTTGKKLALVATGGSYAPPGGAAQADSPGVIVAVFDGNKSKLFQSSNTPLSNLNPGSATLLGITLGNYQLGQYGLGGIIVEAAVWNGALDDLSIRRLNAYAGARYGLGIKP